MRKRRNPRLSQGHGVLSNMGTTLKSEDDIRSDEAHIARLVDELATLASNLFAGEARFVALIGEFDRLDGWADGTTRSCAHWLNWRLGIAMPAARERVRVARRLADLPAIAGAFGQGRLSYSKVRALTRVATEATEVTLLGFGLCATAAQLERICFAWRRVQAQSEPDDAAAQRACQDLSLMLDDDGSLMIQGRLPTEVGVIFAQALAAAAEMLFRSDTPAAQPNRYGSDRGCRPDRRVATGRRPPDGRRIVPGVGSDRLVDCRSLAGRGACRRRDLAAASDGQPPRPDSYDGDYDDGSDTTVPDLPVDPYSRPPLAQVEGGPTIPNPVLLRLGCDATLQGHCRGASTAWRSGWAVAPWQSPAGFGGCCMSVTRPVSSRGVATGAGLMCTTSFTGPTADPPIWTT
ncbi:hypothetical protein BH24ACT15_BH24ACT15_35210 [soil metagenome]